MTKSLQGPLEDLAYALAEPDSGRVAVLTVACRVPAPVSVAVEALEAMVEQGGGSVARDEIDGMRAVRFRDPPPAGTRAPEVDWGAALSELDPDDSWLAQARLDHDVLDAAAGRASRLDPAEIAGASPRTIAEVLERLEAWAVKELLISELDDETGKRRFRLPPLSPLAPDAAAALAPKPPDRKPLLLGVGVAALVLLLLGGLWGSASGDLSDLAAVCKAKRTLLVNVVERHARVEADLKPLLEAPGATEAERTRLMDELAGATQRVTLERKRFEEASAAYSEARKGLFPSMAASAADDAACGYGE